MTNKFIDGIKIGLGVLFVFSIVGIVFAGGYHLASEILPGQFASGDFSFDGNVNVTTGNDFCINEGNCLSAAGTGSGDITDVIAGTGLLGGNSTGSAILDVDTTYLQRRVSSSCAAGYSIRAIAADGTVTCEYDNTGSISCSCGTCWATNSYSPSCGYDNAYRMCTPAGWKMTYQGTNSCNCLVEGSKILLPDNQLLNIENIEEGDLVINEKGQETKVKEIIVHDLDERNTYIINEKMEITGDHPIKTTTGWKVASLEEFENTQSSSDYYDTINATQLEVGDVLIRNNGEETVKSINVNKDRKSNEQIYTLVIEEGEAFYADSYLVANAK